MKSIGLRARIIIIASVFLLVTNLALGAALMRQSRQAMKTQIDERMLDVVNTASDMLDGDVLKRLRAEDSATPEYQAVMDTLNSFRDNIALSYIYCIQDLGDGSFAFTIDSDADDPAADDDYIIDHDINWKPYPIKEQVARIGNSVVPIMAEQIVRANCNYLKVGERTPNLVMKQRSDGQMAFAI